jgi:hypothetical protein
MIEELGALGPEPAAAETLHLFGQFVGAWDLKWHGKDHRGNAIAVRGELYVGWILDGRAVQDIWRVPLTQLTPDVCAPSMARRFAFRTRGLGRGARPGSIP